MSRTAHPEQSETNSHPNNRSLEQKASMRLHESAFPPVPPSLEKTPITNTIPAAEKQVTLPPGFDKAATVLEKFFDGHGMGSGWNRPSDSRAQQEWMLRSTQIKQVMTELDKCATVLDELNKIGGDFKSAALENLPPGWSAEKDDKTGKLKIQGALPETWKATPENDARLKEIHNWVSNCGEEIRKAVANFGENGSGIIRYGDFKHYGKVDVDGEQKDFNVVTYKYSAEKEDDGSIKLTATKQFAKDHLLNYNNWFTSTLASETDVRRYRPDELVPVQSCSGEMTLMRAENLAGTLKQTWNGLKHHGWKMATAVMDVGMTVSGGVGLKAAYSIGSRGYMALNATKLALGASGVLTPAIEQGVLPSWIQTARHCGFLGLVGIETAAHLPFIGAKITAAGSKLVPLTIEQAETFKSVVDASAALKVADIGNKGALVPMVGMLGEESISLYRQYQNRGKESAKVLHDAKRLSR